MTQEPRSGVSPEQNGHTVNEPGADDRAAAVGEAQGPATAEGPSSASNAEDSGPTVPSSNTGGGPAPEADAGREGGGAAAGQADKRQDHKVERDRPPRPRKWLPGIRLAALKAYLKFCMDHKRRPGSEDEDGYNAAFAAANGAAVPYGRLPTLRQTIAIWTSFKPRMRQLHIMKQRCNSGELPLNRMRAEELRHLPAFETLLKAIPAIKAQLKYGHVTSDAVYADALAAQPEAAEVSSSLPSAGAARPRSHSSTNVTAAPSYRALDMSWRANPPSSPAGETQDDLDDADLQACEDHMIRVADSILDMASQFEHAMDLHEWMRHAMARPDPGFMLFRDQLPVRPRKRREPAYSRSDGGEAADEAEEAGEGDPHRRQRGRGAAACATLGTVSPTTPPGNEE